MVKKILRRINSEKRIYVDPTEGIPPTRMGPAPIGHRKLYGPRRGARYPRLVEDVDIKPRVKLSMPPYLKKDMRDRDCLCLPPWNYPPFNARSFEKMESKVFNAAATEEVICTVVVPDGHYARISGFGHDLSDATAWSNFLWRVRVDKDCIYPFAPSITQQIGRIFDPTEVFHIAQEGATIDVWIYSGAHAAFPTTAYARIKGWFWPIK